MLPSRRSTPSAGQHQANEWSTLAIIGTLVAALAVLYVAREIFIPFAFALALSFILTPLATWLQRFHLGRVPSVMLVMIAMITLAGGVSWMVANEMIDVVDHLASYGENIHNKMQGLRAPATGALGRMEKDVAELGKEFAGRQPAAPDRGKRAPAATPENPLPVQVIPPEPSPLASVRDLVRPFLAPIGMFGFVLILTVF